MSKNRQLVQIRTKKLGLLIMDARVAQRRSIEDCAQALGVSPEQFQAYEKGLDAPPLPHLELLALYLDIPLEHFWGKKSISMEEVKQVLQDKDRLLNLRNRMIGTNLRLARNTSNFSYKEMNDRTGISEERLRQYEMGEVAIPLPDLELLAQVLDLPIERFYDQHGPIGRWRSQQGSVQKFLDLPPDVQSFVCKPVNRPYLELAIRLSELSAEKLRGVAETLLEITY
jgi:transcriptional regulator with XRE-family HTH domain